MRFKTLRKFKLFFIFIFIIFSLASFARHKYRVPKRGYADFHCFYVAGQRVLAKENIYVLADQEAAEFRYSPLFAVLMSGLALLSENNADTLWYCLNFCLILISFILLHKLIVKQKLTPREILLFYTLLILGSARFIFHNLDSGQSNILMLATIIIGLYLADKNKWIAAGALLALSVMVKYTPVLFVFYFLYKKRAKLALSMIAFILIYLLLPGLMIGFKTNFQYLQNMNSFLTHSTVLGKITIYDHKNQSLFSLLYRFLTDSKQYFITPTYGFNLFRLKEVTVNLAFAILALIIYSLALWTPKKASSQTDCVISCQETDYALLFICMILFNLNAWVHNYIFLLLPYFLLLYYLIRTGFKDKATLILLVISYLLNMLTLKGIFGQTLAYKAHFYSVHTFSALIIFIALLRIKYAYGTR